MQRKLFIDWARGFAVVAMVLWHTADGWLEPSQRTGQSFIAIRFIGGMAAPSFLFLAGAGAALAARGPSAPARPLLGELARGLEIVLFGYALRLQGWLVDANAISKPYLLRAWLPIVLGYGLFFVGLRAVAKQRPAMRYVLPGLLASAVGLVQVPFVAEGRLSRLLQIDVLQAIGSALILLALGERTFRLLQRPVLALLLALLVASAASPLSSLLPGFLPVPIAAYVAKFPGAPGAPAPALFPLFPWLAYALAGAAFGTLLRVHAPSGDRVVVLGAIAGASLALLTSESHRFTQHLIALHEWLVHPLRVVYRVGLVLVLLWVGWLWASAGRGHVLLDYGRCSLRIYWAHLLVAYGACGALWHKRLPMGKWTAGAALLLIVMWLLARIRLDSLGRARPRLAAGASK